MAETPRIQTTTVGSFSPIDWLFTFPNEQTLLDATRVVVNLQESAGIDLATDGELYRYDLNHPDTNGMIEYFIQRIGGIETRITRQHRDKFMAQQGMQFRRKPAGVVTGPFHEGTLDLAEACARSASVAAQPIKFTLTSPYMLARTLLDEHYGDFEPLLLALADVLAAQVADLDCGCVQVDEANLTGSPENGALAAEAINRILRNIKVERALHLCFGNYGGQSIQSGTWAQLIDFLNRLEVDHLVLECAHRPAEDLEALKNVDARIALGIGVIDVKVNTVESPDLVAQRIEAAEKALGPGRVRWTHPDCGFWMLKRSVAERKLDALVAGTRKYLGQ